MSVGQRYNPWRDPEEGHRRYSFFGWLWRGFVVLFALIGLFVTLFIGGLVAIGVGAFGERDELPDEFVLLLDLDGSVPEVNRPGPLETGPDPATVRDIVDALRRAKDDPAVKGLVAQIGNGRFGLARAQEIRAAIADFRGSGKFAAAFSESVGGVGNGTLEYYVAASFDQIWVQPSGFVGVTGIALEMPFLRGTLDKLEIEPRFEQRYEYKSAVESITLAELSEPARESLQRIADDWLAQIVDGIAADRDLAPDAVRGLVDQAPFLADEARQLGLVDGIGYWDQFQAGLDEAYGVEDAKHVDVRVYLSSRGRPDREEEATTVALIYGAGVIGLDEDDDNGFGERGFDAHRVAGVLERIASSDNIDAVIFRVDSPGGAYVPADVVWRAIHTVREAGKPVIATMGDYAASGGYFVAMAADRIVAQPATLTGSIGVYGGKVLTERFWEKLGVTWDGVHAGDHSTMWSMVQDFSPSAEVRFKQAFDFIYADFTGKVAADRALSEADVDAVARGRVWTGREALEIGLVDANGGLTEALAEVRLALALDPDAPLMVRQLPEPKSRFELILSWFFDGDVAAQVGPWPDADRLIDQALARLEPATAEMLGLLPRRGVLQLPPLRLSH